MVDNAVQRRLAAILVADVVGYSRLMAADEVGTLEALKKRRREILDPTVKAHGGRVVKFMGDGVLVEFTSAVKAVEAAIELQDKFAAANEGFPEDRRVALRIGINLGDVIGEGSDIYGDGVNVAARLEAMAEPGGICISSQVHDAVRGKVRADFMDLGEQSLKNIAVPIRVYSIIVGPKHGSAVPLNANSAKQTTLTESGSGNPSLSFAESAKCSIAVLPFDNMSGESEQDYFADGISEDLLTELSRYRHLAVVSRNSSFVYKGKAVNVQQAGRDLGADFILEGSVRKAGSRVRITAQLIDCATGKHVWAERHDRNFDDIFALQDDIVASILAGLTYNLDDAAAQQRRNSPTANSSAYNLFLQGRSTWRLGNEEGARKLMHRAVEIDPNYARALAYLAFLYGFSTFSQESELGETELHARVMEYAGRAMMLDGNDPFVQHRAAMAYSLIGNWKKALTIAESAHRQMPRDIEVRLVLGTILAYCGRHAEGVRMIVEAGSVEKKWPPGYKSGLFDAHYLSKDYASALAAVSDLVEAPAYICACRGAAFAQLGRNEEAYTSLCEAGARKRNFDPARLARCSAAMCALPQDAENWLEGFRKAGVDV